MGAISHPVTDADVTVMGLGRFGGGLGVTRHLVSECNCRVTVTDAATEESLGKSLAALADLEATGRLRLRLGGHDPEDFVNAEWVVANPAVARPWENPWLSTAREAGVPIVTEIGLAVAGLRDRGRVIGITGSNGKSTTTAMLHHVLERAGLCAHLGGNIGGSLLGRAIGAEDWVVMEFSSAMLYWMESAHMAALGRERGYSPGRAAVTNFSPNHLDWHGTLAHYRRCKEQILRDQEAGDAAFFGADAAEFGGSAVAEGVRRFGPAEPWQGTLRVLGEHNRANAGLAAAIAADIGVGAETIARALAEFPGLPHRLEFVGEWGGVRAYNDSKSTTPGAALRAIGSFDEPGRIHLIAGGYDKKVELTELARAAEGLAGLYAIGEVGPALVSEAGRGRAVLCGTLPAAVEAAAGRVVPGDVVLLSPGCASWDQFEHFEARGEEFVRLVRLHLAGTGRGRGGKD